MAIIVPSKKLYDVQSPQILKNAVKGITIDLKNDNLVLDKNSNKYDVVINQEGTPFAEYTDLHSERYSGAPTVFISAFGAYGTQVEGTATINRFGENYFISDYNPKLLLELSIYDAGSKNAFLTLPKRSSEDEPTIRFTGLSTNITDSDNFIKDINNYDYDVDYEEQKANVDLLDGVNWDFTFYTNLKSEIKSNTINFYKNAYISGRRQDFTHDEDDIKFLSYRHLYNILPFSLNYSASSDTISFNFSFANYVEITLYSDVQELPSTYDTTKIVGCQTYKFKVTKATIVLNETIKKIETTDQNQTISTNNVNGSTVDVSKNQFIKDGTIYNGATNGIIQLWGKVANAYRNGKSYVRFLSSLGDFYDEQGDKVVSTDTSGKMMLDLYDQVVVMKRNEYGKDEPIMYDSSGKAKVFDVVSVKPYFDGAMWQEVVAIEADSSVEIPTVEKLPIPTISITKNILTINDSSGKAEKFEIYADTSIAKVIDASAEVTFDLSTLNLGYGTYNITVIAKATNYVPSSPSASISYTIENPDIQTLPTPYLTITDDTLYVYGDIVNAKSFDILVNNVVKANITTATYDLRLLNLAIGTYSISVIAKATGYNSSAESEAVSYKIEKKTTLGIGKYLFNDTPDLSASITQTINAQMALGDTTYNIKSISVGSNGIVYTTDTTTIKAHNGTAWANDKYKQVEVKSAVEVTTTFYSWFFDNTNKVKLAFTISGKSYVAESGMTWYKWCNSTYNTDNWLVKGEASAEKIYRYVSATMIETVYNGTSPVSALDKIVDKADYVSKQSFSNDSSSEEVLEYVAENYLEKKAFEEKIDDYYTSEEVDVIAEEIKSIRDVVNITNIDVIYEHSADLPEVGASGNGMALLVVNDKEKSIYSYSWDSNLSLGKWDKTHDLKSHVAYIVLTGDKSGIYRYTNTYPHLITAESHTIEEAKQWVESQNYTTDSEVSEKIRLALENLVLDSYATDAELEDAIKSALASIKIGYVINDTGSELNISGYANRTEMQASINASMSELSIDYNEKINSLQFGGRNLYTNSSDFSGSKWVNLGLWAKDSNLDSYGNVIMYKVGQWGGIHQRINAKAGDVYTLSATVFGDGNCWAHFYVSEINASGQEIYGTQVKNYEPSQLKSSGTRIYATYIVKNDCTLSFRIENSTAGAKIKISSLKLERGNKPSDWTKAPEDTDEEFVKLSTDFAKEINDIKNQIDGVVDTWFGNEAPTLTNEPAVNWTTEDDKQSHLGDTYYDNITGYGYRWQIKDGAYLWVEISNSDAVKALEMASKAQDTADGKRRVFVTTPTPPYDVGDLWAVTTTEGNAGDLMRCATARATGSYVETDWVKATKYIDNEQASLTAEQKIQQTQIGGRNLAYYTDNVNCPINHTGAAINSGNYALSHRWNITKIGLWDGTSIQSTVFDEGETYTISYFIRKTAGSLLTIGGHISGFTQKRISIDGKETSGIYSNGVSISDDTAIHYIVVTAQYNGGADNNAFYIQPNRGISTSVTYDLYNIKVEKGDKATDFTPAWEEYYTTVETSAKIKETADAINLSVSALQTTLETNYYTKSEIEVNNNQITQKVMSGIQVGGRNLIIGSIKYTKDKPLAFTPTSNDSYQYYDNELSVYVEKGKTYVLSCTTDGLWSGHLQVGNRNCTIWLATKGSHANHISFTGDGTETGRKTWTYVAEETETKTIRVNTYGAGNATVKFWDFKLEEGNKGTGWTPAPEDVQNRIDTVEGSITLGIQTDGNGKKYSYLNSKADYIHFSGNRFSVTSDKFKVGLDGTVEATGGKFSGEIIATSLTLGSNVKVSTSNVSGLSAIATSGSYNDLSNKPTIPSKTSELTNDSGLAYTSQLPTSVTQLAGGANIVYKGDISQTLKTDSNGIQYTETTVPTALGNKTYKTYDTEEYMFFERARGTDASGNDYFAVSKEGFLKARNAVIFGTVYATDGSFTGTVNSANLTASVGGQISGWKFDSNSLQYGTLGEANSMWLSNTGTESTTANIAGSGVTNGWCLGIGNTFGVKNTGEMFATAGKIGGFKIGTYLLESADTVVGMCAESGHGPWAIWAGAGDYGSKPFRVGHNGSVFANDIHISGASTIGGVAIGGIATTTQVSTAKSEAINTALADATAKANAARTNAVNDVKALGYQTKNEAEAITRTVITKEQIYAPYLEVEAAKIRGTLSASQINTEGLGITNGNISMTDSYGNVAFSVSNTGEMLARKGQIAGWNFETASFTKSDTINYYSGLSTYSNDNYQINSLVTSGAKSYPRFFVNAKNKYGTMGYTYSSSSTPPIFAVLADGSLYASAADISGTINAKYGHIGGWDILAQSLHSNQNGKGVAFSSAGITITAVGDEGIIYYSYSWEQICEAVHRILGI